MGENDIPHDSELYSHRCDCGKLAKIAVDSSTWQVTDLVVEIGLLLKHARVFPISTVIYTESDDIHLSLFSDDRSSYTEYHETVFERPAKGWDGRSEYRTEEITHPSLATIYDFNIAVVKENIRHDLSSELEVIAKGTLVRSLEGIMGRLSHLMTNQETDGITRLVVLRGLFFPEYLDIPVSFVESISEKSIFVALSDEELDGFRQQTEEYIS